MNCQDIDSESVGNLKTTKLRPLFDRVVVQVAAPKEVMKNGILLPDNAVERPLEGIVFAVGQGRIHPVSGERIPIDVKVGDRVSFGRYSGNDLEIFGSKFLILKDDEIFGVFYEE